VWGTGKLQGSDASEALISVINSPDVDDIYYGLDFYVENISVPTPTPTPTPTPEPQYNSGNITLKPGWNFISTPKRLDSSGGNNTAGKLFQDVDSGGHSALMYNGSNEKWEAFKADTIIKPLDAL
jgi:hypothetical protein